VSTPYDNPYEKLTTREEFIAAAAEYEIVLKPGDFTGTEPHLYLDGTPAAQWLDAMTMR
jgi:hypothetical protein